MIEKATMVLYKTTCRKSAGFAVKFDSKLAMASLRRPRYKRQTLMFVMMTGFPKEIKYFVFDFILK